MLDQRPLFPTPTFRDRVNPAPVAERGLMGMLGIAVPLGLFVWVVLAECVAVVIKLLP
jgi:hypothetical protein